MRSKKLSLLLTVLISVPLVANAGGALSIGQCNPVDGKYPFGYALGLNEQSAVEQSQERCSSLSPDNECKPAISFSGPACLALSVEKKNCGAVGWSPAMSNIPDAQAAAIAECQTKGGTECLIALANCSTTPYPEGIVAVPIITAWSTWWANDYWGGFYARGPGAYGGGGNWHGGGQGGGPGGFHGGFHGGQVGFHGQTGGFHGQTGGMNRGGTMHTTASRTTTANRGSVTHTATRTTSVNHVNTMSRGVTMHTASAGGRHPH